jgi:ATP-dependent DNA ligase
MADFEALHSRSNDGRATALAFDLLMLNEDDMRRKPYVERKAVLRKLLRGDRGFSMSNTPRSTAKSFLRLSASWALRVSSQRS